MSTLNELNRRLYLQREEQIEHHEYNQEFYFYKAVALGDIDAIKKNIESTFGENRYNDTAYGHLSDDKIQNARYHFVVSTALITRLCVEYGLNRETAYTLSDIYINKMDKQKNLSSINITYNEMLLDFTNKMRNIAKANIYSIHITKTIEYILNHLHERLSTSDIADALCLNRSHLSTLFKKETGISLHKYIISQKLKSASQLLTTSDISISEISELYSFSSQSHFTKCFREELGMTPLEYQKKYYRKVYSSP